MAFSVWAHTCGLRCWPPAVGLHVTPQAPRFACTHSFSLQERTGTRRSTSFPPEFLTAYFYSCYFFLFRFHAGGVPPPTHPRCTSVQIPRILSR
ncbi:hypothetical protein OBBRIDRAFT_795087 [Obba rivulosa]|uniref:Uncharacterized protein n=1 Tax=Obba rivulosa TaxID=1052685 RepID=A0A8E2DJ32_9APHY|nr:hypothetical protein OBBRIDRAFT_795087 [Obba rivulosa]